ncbi:hypothetical protein D3C80_920860 [compost metagenome]
MIAEQACDRTCILVIAGFGATGLVQRTAQHQRDQGGDGPHHEGNAPAPGPQFIFSQQLLQDHHDQDRQQLAADQGDVLERSKEAALPTQCHFTHVGGRGAVFAPYRQPLDQAGQQ